MFFHFGFINTLTYTYIYKIFSHFYGNPDANSGPNPDPNPDRNPGATLWPTR